MDSSGAIMTPDSRLSMRDIEGVSALAKVYFDAAYTMDADKFATIFNPAASVSRRADDKNLVVTPVASWLDTVRRLASPSETGGVRADQILSIGMTHDMAVLKLRLKIPPREVTDLLSCFYLCGRWQIVQKVFVASDLCLRQ